MPLLSETGADVEKWVRDAKTNLTNFWDGRTTAMTLDRKMRDLDVSVSVPSESKVTNQMTKMVTNNPQNFWDWTVATLANNRFRWRAPKQGAGKEDKQKGTMERLAYGIDWSLDDQFQKRLLEPWRYHLAEQIVGGWYALFPDVVMDGDRVRFTLEFWDPITVFQQATSEGLEVVLRIYSTTLADAQAYAKLHEGDTEKLKGTPTDSVKVVDGWVRESGKVFNVFTVNDQVVLKVKESEGATEIPILTGPVAGRGVEAWSEGDKVRAAANRGRSILRPVIRTYQQTNRNRTLMNERARKSMFPDIVDFTEGGEGFIEPGDVGGGTSNIIHAKTGEDVKTLDMGQMSPDMAIEHQRDRREVEEGTVPGLMFGANDPQVASGFLGKNLEHLAGLRPGRYAFTYRWVAETAFMRMIRQLRNLNKPVTMTGLDLTKRNEDGYFIEEIKNPKKDIPENFKIFAQHELSTPLDKSAVANTEGQLVQAGIHSVRRAMEETGVEDPYEETFQIVQEQSVKNSMAGAAIAAMSLEKQADEFEDAGDQDVADALRLQARVTREQAFAQALQAVQGQNAPQPNQDVTGRSPEEVPVPIQQGGTQPPPPPTRGASQARPGNRSAAGGRTRS